MESFPKITTAKGISYVEELLVYLRECSQVSGSDGKWLEALTVNVAPHIAEWDVSECWPWEAWPDREELFSGTKKSDVGIDCVAVRKSDGALIAIQCKSRYLDGKVRQIHSGELDKFGRATSNSVWRERWVVTNGANPFSRQEVNKQQIAKWKITHVDLQHDLLAQKRLEQHAPSKAEISRQDMQDECVRVSADKLREHVKGAYGGIPIGEARGKIILPCGTGKTRISLRMMESLAREGETAVVLCPSIALVSQIRREYLQNADQEIRILAVCSDSTVSPKNELPKKRDNARNIIADYSYMGGKDIKGDVTTDPAKIAKFICEVQEEAHAIGVILGTYQSGHRIAEALRGVGGATVLICDEAHRTAGIHQQRDERDNHELRNFTICHDQKLFPVTYRIYQTATPKVYGEKLRGKKNQKWIVRDMDDVRVFGVELFRKSYVDAVRHGWLSDYRIIALGINDDKAYELANKMALSEDGNKVSRLSARSYLKGLAFVLAMGNAVQYRGREAERPLIKSCIGFMNTVAGSRKMAEILQSEQVRDWLNLYMEAHEMDREPADYKLQHLDAKSRVEQRELEKEKLSEGTLTNPHAILNVGIFGEGTDSPSLSAVAFLEPRRSPIDVVQAVGRVMRISKEKEFGYIVVPVEIPKHEDPERWLATTHTNEGWKELGDILQALKAHDTRIESEMSNLMQFYLPTPVEKVATLVSIGKEPGSRLHSYVHVGKKGAAQRAAEQVVEKGVAPKNVALMPLVEVKRRAKKRKIGERLTGENVVLDDLHVMETTHKLGDGTVETRRDGTVRMKSPGSKLDLGLDLPKTQKWARKMVNEGEGVKVPHTRIKPPPPDHKDPLPKIPELLEKSKNAITMNLLERSGLQVGKIESDLNMLEDCVEEAGRQLRESGVEAALAKHLQMDNLAAGSEGDPCHISALLLLNAAMLHQRIAEGDWIPIVPLGELKNHPRIGCHLIREWEKIMRKDFEVVLIPAIDIVDTIQETGLEDGLTRALWGICTVAERIAYTYAEMGTDHAGKLFNKYMGNQQSDGAFFTRAPAASIAARLSLDAVGDVDWSDQNVWRQYKVADLACGSGTLLTAMLTEMKRRAGVQGAKDNELADLHKLGVEDTIKGLDVNPISLQLAASQLLTSTDNIKFRRMGLHRMPYGPLEGDSTRVAAGSLELLLQNKIVNRKDLGLDDEKLALQNIWTGGLENIERVVEGVKGTRVVVINPPYSNRVEMGKKFTKPVQQQLRERVDAQNRILEQADPGLAKMTDKNTIRPLFTGLVDHLLPRDVGVFTMINPTVALTAHSGDNERKMLADRYHIHTILTSHQPGNINLSENTGINESVIVMRRHSGLGQKPPTRFIQLDKFPKNEREVGDLHALLGKKIGGGEIGEGWGGVSYQDADRMCAGDWAYGVWREPELAEAAYRLANHASLYSIGESGLSAWATGQMLSDSYEPITSGSARDTFPVLKSKGGKDGGPGQKTIQAIPDAHYTWKQNKSECPELLDKRRTAPILDKSSWLLITAGQDTSSARVTAVASDMKYVGQGWRPITGISQKQALALAVFLNSTPGRLQILRHPGKKLNFPSYTAAIAEKLRIPDIKDSRIMEILADCWERTKDMIIPQYREGECEVRKLWDEAVAEAMGWDAEILARLRNLLHREPHVRGLGHNQYAEEKEED